MREPAAVDPDLYRSVVDSLRVVVFHVDREGRWVFLNPAWAEVTGFEVEDVLGDTFTAWVHEDDLATVRANRDRLASEELPDIRFEVRGRTAFGGWVWFEVWARLLRDGEGEIRGAAGTLTDITERRRVTARLAEAEARFRGAFDHAATGMAILGVDGRTLRVNAAICKLLRRPADELLELTAVDVTHPDDVDVELAHWSRLVKGEIRDFHIEKRFVRPDGELVWGRMAVSLVRDDDGEPLYAVAHVEDVTEARRAADRLAHQAMHDALTGLPNRRLFLDRLGQALARTGRSGRRVGVLFLDVDRFKLINDGLGHAAGDRVLQEVAARIRDVVRPGDTVARFGGDEFAVLLEALHDPDEAAVVARRLEEALAGPVVIGGEEVYLRVSVGVATAHERDRHPDGLIADADAAMYRAKERGRAGHTAPVAGRSGGAERLRLERDLRHALVAEELRVVYQPVVELESGRIAGFEALLRWDDPRHGLRLPGDFLPVAEETGLIVEFGAWALREACGALARWRRDGLVGDAITMAVNLSAAELRSGDIADVVAGALRCAGLEPSALRLEITEHAVAQDADAALPALRALARLGVALVIDDFGIGTSSFGHVKRLPALQELKIDRSFVSGVASTREDAAVVASVISLGRSLGIEVVAEGLETAAQVRMLRELGCTHGQGFWFGRPQCAHDVEQLLRRAALGELGI